MRQRIAATACWSWPVKSTGSKSWLSAYQCRCSYLKRWPTSFITPKQKDVVPAMMGSVVVVHHAFSIRDSRVQPVKWRIAMAKLMKASLWGKREFEPGSVPDNRTIKRWIENGKLQGRIVDGTILVSSSEKWDVDSMVSERVRQLIQED